MAAALLAAGQAAAQAPPAVTPTGTGMPPAAAVTLGAHTLLAQSEGFGTDPAVTAPIATRPGGSALIVFNGGYAGNAAPPVDSYANRWTRLGRVTYGNGYDGFDVKAYVALRARGGPGHTVSFAKRANAAGEISVPFVEVRNAGRLQDVAQNYPAAGLVLTSGSVTTTGPATLVALWWGDGAVTRMTATPNNGFTVIDRFLMLPDNSGVQCAVAFRQVDAAGTYNVSWIGAPIQGAILWLLAFQS
ncbi:hypothetical protein ASG87_11640 [Frateuria sp. Soil773]|nr:hypothetical protein ASG87_11640 [Frateuria sp. Soil773]